MVVTKQRIVTRENRLHSQILLKHIIYLNSQTSQNKSASIISTDYFFADSGFFFLVLGARSVCFPTSSAETISSSTHKAESARSTAPNDQPRFLALVRNCSASSEGARNSIRSSFGDSLFVVSSLDLAIKASLTADNLLIHPHTYGY